MSTSFLYHMQQLLGFIVFAKNGNIFVLPLINETTLIIDGLWARVPHSTSPKQVIHKSIFSHIINNIFRKYSLNNHRRKTCTKCFFSLTFIEKKNAMIELHKLHSTSFSWCSYILLPFSCAPSLTHRKPFKRTKLKCLHLILHNWIFGRCDKQHFRLLGVENTFHFWIQFENQ